jgi:hypothetical protein
MFSIPGLLGAAPPPTVPAKMSPDSLGGTHVPSWEPEVQHNHKLASLIKHIYASFFQSIHAVGFSSNKNGDFRCRLISLIQKCLILEVFWILEFWEFGDIYISFTGWASLTHKSKIQNAPKSETVWCHFCAQMVSDSRAFRIFGAVLHLPLRTWAAKAGWMVHRGGGGLDAAVKPSGNVLKDVYLLLNFTACQPRLLKITYL